MKTKTAEKTTYVKYPQIGLRPGTFVRLDKVREAKRREMKKSFFSWNDFMETTVLPVFEGKEKGNGR
jgi:hypothetical protein